MLPEETKKHLRAALDHLVKAETPLDKRDVKCTCCDRYSRVDFEQYEAAKKIAGMVEKIEGMLRSEVRR